MFSSLLDIIQDSRTCSFVAHCLQSTDVYETLNKFYCECNIPNTTIMEIQQFYTDMWMSALLIYILHQFMPFWFYYPEHTLRYSPWVQQASYFWGQYCLVGAQWWTDWTHGDLNSQVKVMTDSQGQTPTELHTGWQTTLLLIEHVEGLRVICMENCHLAVRHLFYLVIVTVFKVWIFFFVDTLIFIYHHHLKYKRICQCFFCGSDYDMKHEHIFGDHNLELDFFQGSECVNSLWPIWHQTPWSTVVHSGNGLSPVRCQAITWTNDDLLTIELCEQTPVKFELKYKHFHSRKYIWKCCLQNDGHLVQGLTHPPLVAHICIGWDNGLSPIRCQAII